MSAVCPLISVTAAPSVEACSLTPYWSWSWKIHTVKGSKGKFYNSDQSTRSSAVREVFSERPVPDLHPIWRRATCCATSHIPHQEDATVLNLMSHWALKHRFYEWESGGSISVGFFSSCWGLEHVSFFVYLLKDKFWSTYTQPLHLLTETYSMT